MTILSPALTSTHRAPLATDAYRDRLLSDSAGIGARGFGSRHDPLRVNLANYMPVAAETAAPGDHAQGALLDRFQTKSPTERELEKTVKSTQAMVVTYIKGRVPLGDDKFNATDMFRSILDILKAMENAQMVKMMEDGNRIALNNLFMQMPGQVGNKALVRGNRFDFQGDPVNFAVDVPENADFATVVLRDERGEEIKTWMVDGKGLTTLTWNGADESGAKRAPGGYEIVALYEAENEPAGMAPVYVTDTIESVAYDPTRNGGYPEFRGSGDLPIENMLAIYAKPDKHRPSRGGEPVNAGGDRPDFVDYSI